MGPQRTRTGWSRRRKGTKPYSTRSLRAATMESGTRRGDPLNGCARLTCVAVKGGKEGGTHHPAACAHSAQQGNRGGPRIKQRGTPPRSQDQDEEPPPPPQQRAQPSRGQKGEGARPRASTTCSPRTKEGGTPPERQHALTSARHASKGQGGGPQTRRPRRGHLQSSVRYQRTACKEGGGGKPRRGGGQGRGTS